MYALGTDAATAPTSDHYSAELPVGTDKGDYYVWYYVKGDVLHTDTAPECMTANIKKRYFAGHSLSLRGDIAVNFYLDLTADEAANATVNFEWKKDGKIQNASVDMSTAVLTENGYLATCRVSASDMTSDINAALFIENNEVATDTYTVKKYADYILAHTDVPAYGDAAELVKAMLNYGAHAQLFFVPGTDPEDLANVGCVTDVSGVTAETIGDKAVNINTLTGDVTFSGATLSLKSETTLSLYFDSAADLDFDCTGMTVETAKNGKYQVARIRGINAKDLQGSLELTVRDKSTGTSYGTVTYSPMTYCKKVLLDVDHQPATLQNVCKALYLYAAAAAQYFD